MLFCLKGVLKEYDLIILDLHLPDGEGEELLSHLSQISRTKIVVFTSDHDHYRRDLLIQYGVVAYFSKSLKPHFVFDEIKKIFKRLENNKNTTVCVVDDSMFIRKQLVSLFQAHNYNVLQARNGEMLFTLLHNHKIDLILLDLELPDTNGIEILERLKLVEETKEIPVIVISGTVEGNMDMFSKILKSGAQDFLTKPFLFEEVLIRSEIWIDLFNERTKNREHESLLKEYKEAVDVGSIVSKTDRSGHITYVNDAFLEVSGYSREELIGRSHNVIRHPDMDKQIFVELWQTITKGEIWRGVVKNRKKNGDAYFVSTTIKPILNQKNEIIEFIAIRHGITEIYKLKQRLEEELNIQYDDFEESMRFYRVYEEAINESNVVFRIDRKQRILYANELFYTLFCYTKREIIKSPLTLIEETEKGESVYAKVWKELEKGVHLWQGVAENKSKEGKIFHMNTYIFPIKNREGEVFEYMVVKHDISSLVESKNALQKSYFTDKLTGLSNRHRLIEDLSNAKKAVLVIMDIASFKEINDFYGTQIGDKALKRLGHFIQLSFAKECRVYRLQGDEFALLWSRANVQEIETKIKEFLHKVETTSFLIDSNEISMRLTVGVSCTLKDIFETADMAHKRAKKENVDLIVFDQSISEQKEYENNMAWAKKIKEALKEDRIKTFFQPIYDNKKKSIQKYEALVRLIDTNGDIISPFFFLNIAKKTRLYKDITKTVVSQSIEQLKKSHLSFSINISVEDIIAHRIGDYLFDMAQENGVSDRLVLEIVESEGIEEFEAVDSFLKEAKRHGMKIAIDDFGTGYSNFVYLLKLQADYIKIDGSLIKDIAVNKESYKIVKSIVSFAKDMGMECIAEFVSDEEIQKRVEELDIPYSQGYYHGKPDVL